MAVDYDDRVMVAEHLGRRSRMERVAEWVFFLGSAVYCFATAAAYLPPLGRIPAQLEVIDDIMPGEVWAWGWVVCAVLLVVALRWAWARRAAATLFAAMLLSLTASYFVEQISTDSARAWVSMKNYLFTWVVCQVAAYFVVVRRSGNA